MLNTFSVRGTWQTEANLITKGGNWIEIRVREENYPRDELTRD